jgi:hypothetical protein
LRGPAADAGELRQLADQALNRWRVDRQASEAREAETTEGTEVKAARRLRHPIG